MGTGRGALAPNGVKRDSIGGYKLNHLFNRFMGLIIYTEKV